MPTVRELANAAGETYAISPALIEAIIRVESGNDPKAVSRAGAQGLMQLMPGTARDLGIADDDVFRPEVNVPAGTRYFREMLQRTEGDVRRALSAYNTGPNSGKRNLAYEASVLSAMDTIEKERGLDAVNAELARRRVQQEWTRRRQPPGLQAFSPPGEDPEVPPVEAPSKPGFSPGSGIAVGADGQPVFLPQGTGTIEAHTNEADLLRTGLVMGTSGLAAALTGGASLPVQIGAQLATTGAQQALELVPPGLQPYLETLAGDVLGRVGGMGLRTLTQKSLPRTKAGQTMEVTRRIGALGDEQRVQTEVGGQVADRIGAAVKQVATRQERRALDAARATGAVAAESATLRREIGAQSRSNKLADLAVRQHTQEINKTIALARVATNAAEVQNAQSAQTWLQSLPVPTREVERALYTKVDEFADVTLPQEVLDDLYATAESMAKNERALQQFFPGLGNTRVIGLAKAGQESLGEAVAADPTIAAISPGRTAGGRLRQPLSKTPDAKLELQDFLRKPDATTGRYGIALGDDDLFGELHALLGRKESGSARLLNSRQGFSPQQMAERAHAAGFIEDPDVGALVRALDESIFGGRPVYSRLADALEIGYQQLNQLGEAPTFGNAVRALQSYGQLIGEARKAADNGVEGAGKMAGLWSALYGRLQQGLRAAEDNLTLPNEARDALRAANAAHEVRATVDDLTRLIESRIAQPRAATGEVLNLGQLLNDLELPRNKQLVGRLQRILGGDVWAGLQATLGEAQKRVVTPQQQIVASRALLQEMKELNIRTQMGRAEELGVLHDRLQALEGKQAVITQQLASSQAILGTRKERLREMLMTQQAQTAERVADLQQRIAYLRTHELPTVGAGEFAKIGSLGALAGYTVTQNYGGAITGAILADLPVMLSRYLISPQGQRVLTRFMQISPGALPSPTAMALIQMGRVMFPPIEKAQALGKKLEVFFHPPTDQREREP